MTNHPTDRAAVKQLMTRLTTFWMTADSDLKPEDFHHGSQLFSSHHGNAEGYTDITAKLKQDTTNSPMQGRLTNLYVATDSKHAVASFYSFGLLGNSNRNLFLFGSTQVVQLSKINQRWCIDTIRLVINWSKGNVDQVPHWQNLPGEHGWEMGFEAPALVSELHSPWSVMPDAPPPENLQEALEELYYRYAFSVDQNDMGLLKASYTEDISGGFAPVGNLSGRDQVIGTLKNFRHLASVWQHFAEVVRYEEEDDGKHVKLIVARIIPERPVDEAGNTLYGAHYQLLARKLESGQWNFCWTDYRPGWFTVNNLPEFDIGNATA